jgi:hypothetical protein
MLAPYRGRMVCERLLPDPLRCTSLGVFCTFRFHLPGCDRTLRPFPVGGPFPCQQPYSFNPARSLKLDSPVKYPLYARAIDILGCANRRSNCN